MQKERVLSTETKIYHRPACRYARRIKRKNKMELFYWEAKKYGYRPCKCCNTMAYLYQTEWPSLNYFNRNWGLSFRMVDGILYVRTNISCWKLVYSRREEKIALYHRNHSEIPVDFENPQNERYHRQSDCANANSIGAICKMMVIRKEDDLHVANCSFQGITTKTVEIGLDVDKSLQHQGIGTAVLLMLAGYLQEHMPDKKILIKTKSTNLPCQKMVEKAGGIKTGEEPTELETYFRKMIPRLEEKGYHEDAEESRKALSRLEGVRVIVYEFFMGGTTDE